MAMLERSLIEADNARRQNTGQQVTATGKPKLERQTQPQNQGSSGGSSTKLSDFLQGFGV